MRTLFIACILLIGCNEGNKQPQDMPVHTDTDMTPLPLSDDMTPALTADMAQADQPDMLGAASPDMMQTPTPDMVVIPDMTPPPPPPTYTHTDSFCGNTGSTWTDSSPTVDDTSPTQALAACMACCNYILSSACACTVLSGTDQQGRIYSGYEFSPSYYPTATYVFWYASAPYAGSAAIISPNPSDRKNGVWYQ